MVIKPEIKRLLQPSYLQLFQYNLQTVVARNYLDRGHASESWQVDIVQLACC